LRGKSPLDLVVVGAGAAGLAATKRARELGLEVVAFEAMDRIGGRAFTDQRPFGFPWDAGCHWLHSGSINPFARFAEAEGFQFRKTRPPGHTWLGGRQATAVEEAAIDAYITSSLATIQRCGSEGIDCPVADVVDTDSPWLRLLRQLIAAEWGVDIRDASTLDISRYRDTEENWPVEQGYGALVARAASGVEVELETPVAKITWSGSSVRVATAKGEVEAAAAIVTASTNVLADDVIAFDPPLPVWKRDAFTAVPLGRANKVALQVDRAATVDVPEQHVSVPISADQMIGLRLRPFGRDLVDGYLAGPACADLEMAGAGAMIDAASEALVAVLGSDVRNHITATAVSRWGQEPFIRGAYAAAAPCQAERRADLGRAIDDRLFFAGEATSEKFFSTAHGAWETGVHAAEAVARVARGRTAPQG
jgi:monoamine oxidase